MINWFSPKLLKGKNRNNYITHENNDEIDCVFCKKKKKKSEYKGELLNCKCNDIVLRKAKKIWYIKCKYQEKTSLLCRFKLQWV